MHFTCKEREEEEEEKRLEKIFHVKSALEKRIKSNKD
jgi:hypothetical protein